MPTHLAFPIRVTSRGDLSNVAQDSDTDIGQSLRLLLSTRPGERRSAPGYGFPDQLFGTGPVTPDDVTEVIATWEDRAQIDALDVAALITARPKPAGYGAGLYGAGYYGGPRAL